MLPFVTALCPTFRHPTLLANSVMLWINQDYPMHRRELVILDDGDTFANQGMSANTLNEEGKWSVHNLWRLRSAPKRLPSLPAKYNELLDLARADTDIFLVWEDDDTYLPGYVSSHVNAITSQQPWNEFSKPSKVLSDYGWDGVKPLPEENGSGRFHSSMAFTKDLIRRIGGWPDTKRADFDQQLIKALNQNANSIVDPFTGTHQYVYGWHTGSAHCQSTMRSPDDETWYDRGADAYKEVPYVGQLIPKYDDRTIRILAAMGVNATA